MYLRVTRDYQLSVLLEVKLTRFGQGQQSLGGVDFKQIICLFDLESLANRNVIVWTSRRPRMESSVAR